MTVIGAGTLGSRIALMFAAGGSSVRIFNRSVERAQAAKRFVAEQLADTRETLGLSALPPETWKSSRRWGRPSPARG